MATDPKIEDDRFREAAREILYSRGMREGDVEVDEGDDSVSRNVNGDDGAFVMAWVWVRNSEARDDDEEEDEAQ